MKEARRSIRMNCSSLFAMVHFEYIVQHQPADIPLKSSNRSMRKEHSYINSTW